MGQIMQRFHKDVYFPTFDFERFWRGIIKLFPTKHYLQRKKARHIHFPTLAELKNAECFEVYTNFGEIQKACFRVKGERVDYCYVVTNRGGIVTAWLTGTNNTYSLIDKSQYESLEE